MSIVKFSQGRQGWRVIHGEMTVSMDNTITEQDMDAEEQQFVNRMRAGSRIYDVSQDLDVDGLSDSILARLKRFFSFGRV